MRQKIWISAAFAALLLLGILGSVLVLRKQEADRVEIVQDGTVLYELDLAGEEDRVFDVEYEGHVNRIEIRDHRIRVLEADCPDHLCIRQGEISSEYASIDAAAPIVCLPHRLVIQAAEKEEELDAVAR